MRRMPANFTPARPTGLLTFAELVAPSGFFATWLFAFDGPRVAAQKTGSLESRAEFRIHFQERAGDPELGRFGLPFDPPAGGIDLHIVFIGELDRLERQLDLVLEVYQRKILLVILVVDNDLTVAF